MISIAHQLVDMVSDETNIAKHIKTHLRTALELLIAEMCDTVPLYLRVMNMYESEGKIPAIRVYRNHSGESLLECKLYVESLCKHLKTPAERKLAQK